MCGGGGLEDVRSHLASAAVGRGLVGDSGSSLEFISRVVSNLAGTAELLRGRASQLPDEVRALLGLTASAAADQFRGLFSPAGAAELVRTMRGGNASRAGPACCAASRLDPAPAPASLFGRLGRLGRVAYTAGAVFAAFELYQSWGEARQLGRRLQRLRDSSGEAGAVLHVVTEYILTAISEVVLCILVSE